MVHSLRSPLLLRSRPFLAVLALVLAGLPPVSAAAQDPAGREAPAPQAVPPQEVPPLPAPLRNALPELQDQSAWAQEARYEGERPDKSRRGVYPVGNGRVFTYMGLGTRANTMQALTGPQYQTEEVFAPKGHFGEATLELLVGGQAVELPLQRVRRVRGANFVVTEDAAPGGLALRTLTFAPPDQTRLLRIVEVVNQGAAARDGVTLRLTVEGEARAEAETLRKSYGAGTGRAAEARFALQGGRPDGQSRLVADLGSLAPQQSLVRVLEVATWKGSDAKAAGGIGPRLELAACTEDARATAAWWRQKLAGTAYLDTDHRKLKDLYEDWKILMLVQRCARSGAVSPMVNYRGAWVRDTCGPMLMFLRYNMWEEARGLLEYAWKVTRLLDRVPNHVPLDLDFGALAQKQTDWNKVEVPGSEVPSWLILQHFWYWRVTQDTALIREHLPLLEACLKRQRRAKDSLMKFHGDESYLHGALYSVYPERQGPGSSFMADDPRMGREAWSFSSGVLFLLSTYAFGEMLTAIDKQVNPAKYSGDVAPKKPGDAFTEAAFKIMADLEKRYWLDGPNFFAPALSPLNEEPHAQPFANVNLMPLWVGWTFPTGEKSRDNLRNTLQRLHVDGRRIGTTPTSGWATGHLQGMLLVALVERDGKARLDVFDELLKMAEPAGEWGELYDPRGRPAAAYDAEWPNRLRPWESGVNLDAVMFALCGSRYASVPNWDNNDIRLKLRLPHGATYVTLKALKKDGRHLDVYMREKHAKLSPQELEANEQKKPEERRDPTQSYRRIAFHVDLESEDPQPKTYWDVAANAANTVFVRYLQKSMPIDETEFWQEDRELFFRDEKPEELKDYAPKPPAEDASILFLGSRTLGAELLAGEGVTIVDTGLPATAEALASRLLTPERKPSHARLYLDWGWRHPGRATFKPDAFWSSPVWQKALADFAAGGGVIEEPGYLQQWELQNADGSFTELRAEAGRLHLTGEHAPAAGAPRVVRTQVRSDQARDAVLRLGSGCSVKASLGGKPVHTHEGARHPLPDLDAQLVRLEAGVNTIELVIGPGGTPVVWLRVTDARGLPLSGVDSGVGR